MKRVHNRIRRNIFNLLDIFYPLFKRFMPLQTYHYAACGGSNTALSILLYFISYNYILKKQVVHFGMLAISPHIMALLIASCITLPIGFYLSMFVVFQGSYLRRRIQFLRYFLVVLACLILNYVFLKFFVEVLGWYPTVSQIINTVIIVCFSYLSQRHFSFKIRKITKRIT
ncbi:MAG TPA: GtrA family protein [Chitinophagaceae bacterium]|nr:GtrA family protein [Chitinophagaceae bacterium]